MELGEPLGDRGPRPQPEHAGLDHHDLPDPPAHVEAAVAGEAQAGIDAEDAHGRETPPVPINDQTPPGT